MRGELTEGFPPGETVYPPVKLACGIVLGLSGTTASVGRQYKHIQYQTLVHILTINRSFAHKHTSHMTCQYYVGSSPILKMSALLRHSLLVMCMHDGFMVSQLPK